MRIEHLAARSPSDSNRSAIPKSQCDDDADQPEDEEDACDDVNVVKVRLYQLEIFPKPGFIDPASAGEQEINKQKHRDNNERDANPWPKPLRIGLGLPDRRTRSRCAAHGDGMRERRKGRRPSPVDLREYLKCTERVHAALQDLPGAIRRHGQRGRRLDFLLDRVRSGSDLVKLLFDRSDFVDMRERVDQIGEVGRGGDRAGPKGTLEIISALNH